MYANPRPGEPFTKGAPSAAGKPTLDPPASRPALRGDPWHPNEVANRSEQSQAYYSRFQTQTVDHVAAAQELGYTQRIPPQKAPFDSHGQDVFFNGTNYISPDVDAHNVTQGWKMFDRSTNRIGIYSSDLTEKLKK